VLRVGQELGTVGQNHRKRSGGHVECSIRLAWTEDTMKFASLHDLDLEAFSRDAARQVGALFRGKPDPTEPARNPASETAVSRIVDDPFTEAVNFCFDVRGVEHRALMTYDALHERYAADGVREEALALFMRHVRDIGALAVAKQKRTRMEPVVLEDGDL
jgi:hypothetical protein